MFQDSHITVSLRERERETEGQRQRERQRSMEREVSLWCKGRMILPSRVGSQAPPLGQETQCPSRTETKTPSVNDCSERQWRLTSLVSARSSLRLSSATSASNCVTRLPPWSPVVEVDEGRGAGDLELREEGGGFRSTGDGVSIEMEAFLGAAFC
jgi:hypothetical protein